MTQREVIREVLLGRRPPYVPWHYQFTAEAGSALVNHYGSATHTDSYIDNHILELGSAIGFFDPLDNDRFRDVFGVVWNRSVDKDIGIVDGLVLPEPTLEGWRPPDPLDARFFQDIPTRIARHPNRFRVFYIGFSLFERAWTLRGMENLMLDFIEAAKAQPGYAQSISL